MADKQTAHPSPSSDASSDASSGTKPHQAGAFDIRNIIGALIALYGVVLIGMGLFADPENAKTGDVNANLYAGIAMLVVGIVFLAWARLKPIVVPAGGTTDEQGTDRS